MTSYRKSRHISDIYDAGLDGTMTIWLWNKLSKTASLVQTKFVPTLPNPIPSSPRGYQFTDSENHAEWRTDSHHTDDQRAERALYEEAYKGVASTFGSKVPDYDPPSGDIGGEFYSKRTCISADDMQRQHLVGTYYVNDTYDWKADYVGPALVTTPQGITPPVITESDLRVMGTKAIALCSPTNQLAVALADFNELRQSGLPKLLGADIWKSKALTARNAGGEYLNKKFGWDPLVADVKDVAFTIANAGKILDQLQRDSGKVVRRKYGFPVEETQSVSYIGLRRGIVGDWTHSFNMGQFNVDPTEILSGGVSGALYRERHTYKRVWFSGAFTYHVPWGYNSHVECIRDVRRAQTLIGLDFTPETLWAATPWTWALGWFSNSGDVVHNLSAWSTDGQVLRYGYVMEHQIITDKYFTAPTPRQFTDVRARPSQLTVSVEMKRRVKATPFGFTVGWDGMTPQQLAIAVALGLTKGVFHFGR